MADLLSQDDELELDLRIANRQERTRFFVARAVRQHRLSQPVKQLSPRGVYVPTPGPLSRGAVVKLWSAKATTSAAHSRYLTRGKGIDGLDAPLFGPRGEVDRQAFATRAQDDSHQFRFIVAFVPPVMLDWVTFTQRLMAQMSHDVRSTLDYLGAIHYDKPFVHGHVQLRAHTDDGKPLYLTKDYWTSGLRYRAQQIATQFLGHLTPDQAAREPRQLAQVAEAIRDVRPTRPRVLAPDEVQRRLLETQQQVARFKAHVHRLAQRQAERQGTHQGEP